MTLAAPVFTSITFIRYDLALPLTLPYVDARTPFTCLLDAAIWDWVLRYRVSNRGQL